MFRKPIFIVALVLVLATMACSININLPVTEVKTGPTQSEDIHIAAPAGEPADLTLAFAAGELRLAPGAEGALVSGTATYNVSDFKPKVAANDNKIRLETGDLEIKGIPSFSGNVKNEWNLKLGDTPMNLTINAGAYQGNYELGGLALQSLEVADGAADVRLDFSQPNKTEMDTLRYQTGASNVRLSGLANANFSTMIFRSGAGDYTLDFSGDLKRDADISIQSGISKVTLIVPDGMAAQVIFKGGLSNVTTTGGWQKSGGDYVNAGSGPTLTVNVDMGAGNLELRNQ